MSKLTEDCKGWSGLEADGEKLPKTDLSDIPGIFTGAELQSIPAEIELPMGEVLSLCSESTKPKGSSKLNSSSAVPKK